MKHKSVMVVDDDPDVLHSMTMLLEDEGYDVNAVSDWHKAEARAIRKPPDLILLDLKMPGFSPGAFMDALRQDARLARVPVVLFSAVPEAGAEAARLKADAFLAKPLDYPELAHVLDQLFARPPPAAGGGVR